MLLLWCRGPQVRLLFQEADHSHSKRLQYFNCWSSYSCFWETLRNIELFCAAMSSIWLNTSTISDPHSLFVSLTFLLILGQDYLNKILFQALINSKSTYCFVDSKFRDTYHLKTSATLPVALYLFDEPSNNNISKIANLSINFSTSDCMNLEFYVILLDSSCFLVLGYNWLI